MNTCPEQKIDSNLTGLRFAWERCLKELWPNPSWNVLEPNSYSDFGSTITTVARAPINPARSKKKGTVTDLDAAGGFTQDLTQTNLLELSQAFFFANARQRASTIPLDSADSAVTAVDTTTAEDYIFANVGAASAVPAAAGSGYVVGDVVTLVGGTGTQAAAELYIAAVDALGAVSSVIVQERGQYGAAPANPAATTGGTGAGLTLTVTTGANAVFKVDDLVLASGFGIVANNGLKTIASVAAGKISVDETVFNETPPAGAALQTIGHQFLDGEMSIALNGGLVRLVAATEDLTTMGFIPGEWIFVGGDTSVTQLGANIGFARISTITAGYFELDKVTWTPAVNTGVGKTLRIFYGTVVRNETDPSLIVYKTLQLERTLGNDLNGVQSEYLIGATANEMTINVAQASLCTVDMTFVACDKEDRSGLVGLKAGTRPALVESDAFNTTDSFHRINMSIVDPATATPAPLFGYYTDCTIAINNGVSPNKAVGVLGAFATTAADFEVTGSVNAYFTTLDGPRAVRNNADVTIDYILVKHNAGMIWDMPLLALGSGAVQVDKDQPVMVGLETNAAQSKFGHTLLMQNFPYLPSIAEV